jgi:hypothetical protein
VLTQLKEVLLGVEHILHRAERTPSWLPFFAVLAANSSVKVDHPLKVEHFFKGNWTTNTRSRREKERARELLRHTMGLGSGTSVPKLAEAGKDCRTEFKVCAPPPRHTRRMLHAKRARVRAPRPPLRRCPP